MKAEIKRIFKACLAVRTNSQKMFTCWANRKIKGCDITRCGLSIFTSEINPKKIILNMENTFIYKDVYSYFTYYIGKAT